MTARVFAGPPDAKINPEGFRTYRWPKADGGEHELLSVTSIRKLVGEPYGLVNWQIGKVLDRALGRDFRVKFNEVCPLLNEAQDGPGWPSAGDLLSLRKWLRAATTEERDAAATKGIDIHGALEHNLHPDDCNEVTRPYIRQVHNFLGDTGFKIVAQEFQCFNLAVGYAGTGDVMLEGPDGELVLGDWKSSKNVHSDHIIQLHAYLGGEFIGKGGVINEELTAKLHAIEKAGILHIKPNGWTWHEIPFSPVVLRAFFGAVAFAQLLAAHKTPDALFSRNVSGAAT
jgi:hypothetical protein